MIKLTNRLAAMAAYIHQGERVADIGTDHGLLPLFMWEQGISPHVIMSDINQGPLEKARANMQKYFPGHDFDIRLGTGLAPIEEKEVDAIVIAGMGGQLMADILSEDLQKARSFRKLILQPRNAQDKLRGWLLRNGFVIYDERLVREGKYLCEIIAAKPCPHSDPPDEMRTEEEPFPLFLEISPILFQKKDPLLVEFLENKIRIENKKINEIQKGTGNFTAKGREALRISEQRIKQMHELQKRSREKNEYEVR